MLTLLQALKIYSKSSPEETFADIEKKMREEAFKIHIIALVSLPSMFSLYPKVQG